MVGMRNFQDTFETRKQSFISSFLICMIVPLRLSCRRHLSYKNQSIDLLSKSKDWFLFDRDLRHERVKEVTSYARV